MAFVKLIVDECRFYERLAVIECAVDLNSGDVAAQSGELGLLDWTYLSMRIEHKDSYARHIEESVGYGASRVARCGHKHIDIACALLLAVEVREHMGHESRADILECKCRAMKQFEHVAVVVDLAQWYVEAEGVGHDIAQLLRVDIIAEECIGHYVGNLM